MDMIQNIIFSCLVLLSMGTNLIAKDFTGGISGGITASQIDGDSQSGYNKVGIYGGGFVQRQISTLFTAQLEMKFMQKGMTEKTSGTSLSLQYIEVPVLVQYQYKSWPLFFEGGMAIGYLISSTANAGTTDKHAVDGYNTLSFDAFVGVNYVFSDRFRILARGSYSVLPIKSIENSYSERSQYNNVLSFGVAYLIVD